MRIYLSDPKLIPVREKVIAGTRLDADDGLVLFQSHDIIGIGRLANFVREKRHGKKAFYIYNQHVNYTNVCINGCRFCAFSRKGGEGGAYTMTAHEVREKLISRIHEPINEIHMVGGIHPDLPFTYYLDLLKTIKEIRPHAVIKAFTAVEIDHLAKLSGLSLEGTLQKLKDAGLEMVPGGGAEVLSSRVHDKLFPKKIGHERWLEIVAAIHGAGLTSNATLLYGHIETLKERVDHLVSLRNLQDRTGGFTAFIPLAFHSKNTRLSHLPATTAHDDLKNIAVARLMLDNFDHIKAYWVMIGEKLAQVALSFGADDLDGTIIEEKITHMAGATSSVGLTRPKIRHMITSAGFEAVERDSFYRAIG
ncbi:MAG: aminofutalosine synthase MqnE [Desulfobacterales bacterium CG23_combo_of_CG06-09_8_20_14_all_51_8]|nr:MAG: aminofutalosine synthase MqnE [Desulfobacterales bacterium CG23_combo_of_CG06-09_8_20_14_all_51_8]